ncbi:MAG: saccharopine dehydrogenase NADP-binding domain-containing protein, partial [Wenzhouxiangellaceae bacterium]
MAQAREFDLVVMGATGFTGRLVAEHLLARHGTDGELRWALAGRNPAKLEEIRAGLGENAAGLPLITADSHDRASLDSLVQKTRVICTTV